MKKIVFITLLVSIYFLLGENISLPPDLENIVKKGKLRVGMVEKDQPPFFFMKNGQLVGYDVDLAKGIGKTLGVEIVFERSAKNFNDLIPQVVNSKVDIAISKLSKTATRSKFVKFTVPYITFKQAFLINRLGLAQYEKNYNEKLIVNFKKFKGEIGIIKGSSYINFSKKYFPLARIVELDNWNDVVEAVFNNQVLVGYRDELEIKKVLKVRKDAKLKVQSIVFKDTKDDIAIAVRWYENGLLAFLNSYIESSNFNITTDFLIKEYLD